VLEFSGKSRHAPFATSVSTGSQKPERDFISQAEAEGQQVKSAYPAYFTSN
jgi:hypothetical protein